MNFLSNKDELWTDSCLSSRFRTGLKLSSQAGSESASFHLSVPLAFILFLTWDTKENLLLLPRPQAEFLLLSLFLFRLWLSLKFLLLIASSASKFNFALYCILAMLHSNLYREWDAIWFTNEKIYIAHTGPICSRLLGSCWPQARACLPLLWCRLCSSLPCGVLKCCRGVSAHTHGLFIQDVGTWCQLSAWFPWKLVALFQ